MTDMVKAKKVLSVVLTVTIIMTSAACSGEDKPDTEPDLSAVSVSGEEISTEVPWRVKSVALSGKNNGRGNTLFKLSVKNAKYQTD